MSQWRGAHIHAAYYFNGNEVRRDVYKAQQIGELWERITRGQGCFNSCNHNKELYSEQCALGVVRRDDLVSAAVGYWQTKVMMPSICASTATATACSR